MTAFRKDPAEWQRLDWRLFLNGAVALYHSPDILAEDLSWLREHGYQVCEFHCDHWTSETTVHSDFKQVLNFPDYYGCNLNALHDCLSDISIPEEGGIVLVLHRYDDYLASDGAPTTTGFSFAEAILDILAGTSRHFLLTGQRFLVMIQSSDPRIRFDKLGCISAHWNPREWLNKNRGL